MFGQTTRLSARHPRHVKPKENKTKAKRNLQEIDLSGIKTSVKRLAEKKKARKKAAEQSRSNHHTENRMLDNSKHTLLLSRCDWWRKSRLSTHTNKQEVCIPLNTHWQRHATSTPLYKRNGHWNDERMNPFFCFSYTSDTRTQYTLLANVACHSVIHVDWISKHFNKASCSCYSLATVLNVSP